MTNTEISGGHPELEREERTHELMLLSENTTVAKAALMLLVRVVNYEVKNKKSVSRLFLTVGDEGVTCEAFYKDRA